jgi:hypothetical protein
MTVSVNRPGRSRRCDELRRLRRGAPAADQSGSFIRMDGVSQLLRPTKKPPCPAVPREGP